MFDIEALEGRRLMSTSVVLPPAPLLLGAVPPRFADQGTSIEADFQLPAQSVGTPTRYVFKITTGKSTYYDEIAASDLPAFYVGHGTYASLETGLKRRTLYTIQMETVVRVKGVERPSPWSRAVSFTTKG